MNHMAAKIIENVCSRPSRCAQGFIVAEVGPALWYLFTHSTLDALRISAMSVSNTLFKFFLNPNHFIESFIGDFQVSDSDL